VQGQLKGDAKGQGRAALSFTLQVDMAVLAEAVPVERSAWGAGCPIALPARSFSATSAGV